MGWYGPMDMNELLSTTEMAWADQLSIKAGTRSLVLMERAGRAVAEVAAGMVARGSRIAVVCGPGNNGGDGFVAARLLAGRGYPVTVFLYGNQEALNGDAASVAAMWDGAVLSHGLFNASEVDLLIDGLFGAGLSRPIEGEAAGLVVAMNQSGKPILSIDVPSGVDGNTGQILGCAVKARKTVTFFRLKPGHILYPGRKLCRTIELADIGIERDVLKIIQPLAHLNTPALWRDILLVPDEEGHKFIRGHLIVLSGGVESTGAARLAAHAAARVGAGLVTVASPSDALLVNAAALTDIMVRGSDGAAGLGRLLEDQRRNAVILGPGNGVGEALRECVALTLAARRALVLDADALTSFSGDADALKVMLGPWHAEKVVATPHDGEFSRLFSAQTDILAIPDRLGRARAAARFLGIVVVLKGPDCVIAAPDGRAAINQNGTPWLATAGSGDVLSGTIGGLLAQGASAFEAAAAGVWLHAEAGRAVGPGLLAHDLPQALRGVIAQLIAPRGAA